MGGLIRFVGMLLFGFVIGIFDSFVFGGIFFIFG